jgi:hypothetical protein
MIPTDGYADGGCAYTAEELALIEGGYLHDEGGYLYLGENILICRYRAGDCDSIQWPNPNWENLRSALYDCREVGLLPSNCRVVTLPDDSLFDIDRV